MSKAIMIADKPIWCGKIMNGDKLIEVRRSKALYKATKKLIEEQGYATFFMYCTKEDSLCRICKIDKDRYICGKDFDIKDFPKLHSGYEGKGKVVAKFTVRKVEEITNQHWFRGRTFYTKSISAYKLIQKSCLSDGELSTYLKEKNGYAYHIEDLVIFDKPKELSEFNACSKCTRNLRTRCLLCHVICTKSGTYCNKRLTKAPQNFCYVESEE